LLLNSNFSLSVVASLTLSLARTHLINHATPSMLLS